MRVRGLAASLSRDGCDCRIDVHKNTDEDWPTWMTRQLEEADFVLCIVTETYTRRFRDHELPDVGLGAGWEAGLIRRMLYAKKLHNDSIFPVFFADPDRTQIPIELQGYDFFLLTNQNQYVTLLRKLLGRPQYMQPKKGRPPRLTTEAVAPLFDRPETKAEAGNGDGSGDQKAVDAEKGKGAESEPVESPPLMPMNGPRTAADDETGKENGTAKESAMNDAGGTSPAILPDGTIRHGPTRKTLERWISGIGFGAFVLAALAIIYHAVSLYRIGVPWEGIRPYVVGIIATGVVLFVVSIGRSAVAAAKIPEWTKTAVTLIVLFLFTAIAVAGAAWIIFFIVKDIHSSFSEKPKDPPPPPVDPVKNSIDLIRKYGTFTSYDGNDNGKVMFKRIPDTPDELRAIIDALQCLRSSCLDFSVPEESNGTVNHASLSDGQVPSLAKLQSLRVLLLAGNDSISDSTDFAGMAKLQELDLSRTSVAELNGLAKLDALSKLVVEDAVGKTRPRVREISDITLPKSLLKLQLGHVGKVGSLAGLKNLVTLDVHRTDPTATIDIAGLEKLEKIELENADCSEIIVGHCDKLHDLTIKSCAAKSIRLGTLHSLRSVAISHNPNLEKAVLRGNNELESLIINQNNSIKGIDVFDCGEIHNFIATYNPALDHIGLWGVTFFPGDTHDQTVLDASTNKNLTLIQSSSDEASIRNLDVRIDKAKFEFNQPVPQISD